MSITRCLFLGQAITTNIAGLLLTTLHYYYFTDVAEYRNRTIFFYINSCGGALVPGLGIFDAMLQLKEIIYTIGLGIVASTATLLLSGGTYSFRYTAPHNRVLIHQPRAFLRDVPAWLFIKNAYFVQQLRKLVVQCYCMRTPQNAEFIEKSLDVYTFMSPEEALDFGLVDRIGVPRWRPNMEEPPFEFPEEGNEGFEIVPELFLQQGRRARRRRRKNPNPKVKRLVLVGRRKIKDKTDNKNKKIETPTSDD
uniref:ATP-dependent Clp protease proteolytic subunit n=1 Tax=Gnetum luofuense TaxID=288818 RepID=A0A7D6JWW1_9SPER|nr:ATP-dependent Clp protease proteolytic subunit [Gnetum luofuense]QLO81981.1 ATP-dependent Clp protease proteolytic subunit [Gnetum luofuense]BDI62939.1 ATP-dependent Clp protease proteolytic subunit [Gnetum hainanense]